jgi:hypothetical protein
MTPYLMIASPTHLSVLYPRQSISLTYLLSRFLEVASIVFTQTTYRTVLKLRTASRGALGLSRALIFRFIIFAPRPSLKWSLCFKGYPHMPGIMLMVSSHRSWLGWVVLSKQQAKGSSQVLVSTLLLGWRMLIFLRPVRILWLSALSVIRTCPL